ncbi:MAG: FG-GAP-like repeat-containing protein [Acidobacteriota bacterium]
MNFSGQGSRPGPRSKPPPADVSFVDEAAEAGVILLNVSGGAEKRHITETTGAGPCFLDYDLDNDIDLYIVNGATLDTMGPKNPAQNALYRNDGEGRFTDTSAEAGVANNGWGGGCAVADYDNDADPDIYVTNYGSNVLYRNEGNGRFRDVTTAAGVGDVRWSLGAAFLDVDRDGDLDLYVANYLHLGPADLSARSLECRWKGTPVMCGPRGFQGEADALFLNNGNGTFTDSSVKAGIAGRSLYGMGVVTGDVDDDGDTDIFVANDSQDNNLFINDGRGRFEDNGLFAGVALSGDGREQASMGADLGDYDNDGDEDLIVTNFSDDYHTLYRNDGKGLFTDASTAAGLDPATRSSLGWGVGFLDYDNDGDLDLFIASGHVYTQVDGRDLATSYRQQNLLFRNEGDGRFKDVSNKSGPGLLQVRSSRGVAFGDYDNDGDIDITVLNENDVPSLLRNDGGNARHWIKIRLVGSKSNRDGIGARVSMHAGGRTQYREYRLNSGYCSSHDPRIHFGLDSETKVERLEIRWPSGRTQVFSDLQSERLVTVHEERGIIDIAALREAKRIGSTRARDTTPPPQPATKTSSSESRALGRRLSLQDLREIDAIAQTGTRQIMAGRYSEGIGAYNQVLKRLPSWPEASQSTDALGFGDRERYRIFLASLYDNLGVGLMRAERLDECAAAVGTAIAILPGRAKFHHNLGLCHFHARRYNEAIAAFRAAQTTGENRVTLSYDLGRAFALAGSCQEAVRELSLAIGQLPANDSQGRRGEAWYYLGSCHSEHGEYQAATNAFRETLSLAPGHQKALYKLGVALRRMGQVTAANDVQELFQSRQPFDEAVRAMKRAAVSTLPERLHLVRLYQDAGLTAQALTEIEMVIASRRGDATTFALLGELYLALRPPTLDRAEAAFQTALQLDPRKVDALAGLGETLRRRGKNVESEGLFRQALEIQPGHAGAIVGLAQLFFSSGKTTEAVQMLKAALEQKPNEDETLRALAEIYATVESRPFSRPDEALRLLDKASKLYGEGTETRIRAYMRLGERQKAQTLIEQSPFLGVTERATLKQILAGK